MFLDFLEPKTECLPECLPDCHLECHPEYHPECQDQLDMVRSHTVMVLNDYLPKKSLVVGGGEW